MRVVVVGASGNLGTALLRRFAADQTVTSVVGIARRVPERPPAPYDVASWVSCDIADTGSAERLAATFVGADSVVHLARATGRRRPDAVNLDGTRRVLDAARRAGVPQVVVASSPATCAPAPDDVPRGEGWATDDARSRLVGEYDDDLTIADLRTAWVLQRAAGHQFARSFLGPLAPRRAIGGHLAVLSWPAGLRLQVVHADDAADAYREAVVRRVRGPFNVAGPGVLRGQDVADVVSHGRLREVPPRRARFLTSLAWHARVAPLAPSLLDQALVAPLLDVARASRELDFRPRWTAVATLRDMVAGIAAGAGTASPPLRPRRPNRT